MPGHTGWSASPRVVAGLGGLADVEYRSGAWDDSKRHAEQAISLVNDTEQTGCWPSCMPWRGSCRPPRATGGKPRRTSPRRSRRRRRFPMGPARPPRPTRRCISAFCRGDPLAAVTAAEVLLEATDGAPREPGVMGWAGQYASALIDAGPVRGSGPCAGGQTAVAQRLGRRSALATVARIRGELAMARRQPAEARAAFNTAVTLGAGSATVLDQAWTQALYGRFLRRAGERRAAGDRLRAARDTFARLGATPFLDMMQRRARCLRPGRRPPAGSAAEPVDHPGTGGGAAGLQSARATARWPPSWSSA